MFIKNSVLFVLLITSFVGCATNKHEDMKGTVALKINGNKGIACLFGDSPSVGDKLDLFQSDCSGTRGRESSVSCKMVKSGEATVTKLVNDHYAEFETIKNVLFEEGYVISLKK